MHHRSTAKHSVQLIGPLPPDPLPLWPLRATGRAGMSATQIRRTVAGPPGMPMAREPSKI